MYLKDEGYLLSKNKFYVNSTIIEAFTLEHGKYTGIVYGGTSRKQKGKVQIGTEFLLDWKSKTEKRSGDFTVELIRPVSPFFFDDKKRSTCLLSAASILKILLPERQINEKIYNSFEKMLSELSSENWITLYIYWELSLIKDLGFETNFFNKVNSKDEIKKALIFNKNLLMDNFIVPNKLKFPLSRNILENYYN